MSKINYLLRRNGKCYFRIKVPPHLQDALNKKEIKKSLRTSDIKEAKQRIPLELFEAQQQFADAEKKLKKSISEIDTSVTSSVSNTELERLIVLWFQKLELKSEEFDYAARASMLPEEQFETVDSLRDDLAGLESGIEATQLFQNTAKDFIAEHDLQLEKSDKQYAHLCKLIQRAEIQHTYNRLSIYGDVYSRLPDKLFTAPATQTEKAIYWKQVLEQFITVKKSEKVAENTLTSYKLISDFTSEYFGSECDVRSITTQTCRELIQQLSTLPSRARIHHPNLSLIEASKLFSEGDKRCLSAQSIKNEMQRLNAIFNFAFYEGWVDKNPMKGIKKPTPNQQGSKPREPFSIEDLNHLFRTEIYTGEKAPYNSHKFWIPLIALYSGMRQNEICQLLSSDVEVVEGIPVIHLRKDDPIKKFKNKSSIRTVPIHPVLQDLGFVDFALNAQKQLQKMLFSDIRPNSKGSYSDNFSKWFGRKLISFRIKREGLVFHSFRHTFRDAARNCNLDREALSKIGGWELSNDVMDTYGKGHSLQRLYDEIKKIEYVGLDLTHL